MYNDPIKCIVTSTGNPLCLMFIRKQFLEIHGRKKGKVNFALTGLRL